MSELSFRYYMQIEQPEYEQKFRTDMEKAGYFAFYRFVEDFRMGLKQYADEDVERFGVYLDRARRLFPVPTKFSPSWDAIWESFDIVYSGKNKALAAIPVKDREGEWQVLLDNPFTNQPVVCYPSLGFLEAAYMYGHFQRDLKPNECLRLQKVTELLVAYGNRQASIFPES